MTLSTALIATPAKKPKVALVVPGGVDRSGTHRVIPAVLALIRRLSARCELRVYSLLQEPRPTRWELCGVPVENIGRRATTWRALRAIRREHRDAPFDVVHSLWSGSVGLIAVLAGKTLRIPSVVHVAGGELAALEDIGFGGRRRFTGRVREWMIMNGADAVTAASHPILDQVRELGVQAQRIALGVDLDTWPAQPPRPRDPREPVRLVHVASLNRVKDQPTLLRALRLLADAGVDFHLDVIGEDTLGGAMQALAAQLGLQSRVRFHGFLTRAAARPLVANAHLNLVSSRHEAGPLVVLEAAVLGVPTVGTAVGHISEWEPEAAIGLPVAEPVAMSNAIRALIDDEPARLALGRAAQQRALAEDADFTCEQFMALYARLIDARRVSK